LRHRDSDAPLGAPLTVIFARRENARREEDGPASSRGRGHRGCVATGTACLRVRAPKHESDWGEAEPLRPRLRECSVPGRGTLAASESAPAVLSTTGAPFAGYAGLARWLVVILPAWPSGLGAASRNRTGDLRITRSVRAVQSRPPDHFYPARRTPHSSQVRGRPGSLLANPLARSNAVATPVLLHPRRAGSARQGRTPGACGGSSRRSTSAPRSVDFRPSAWELACHADAD
jgi:hypothetical protein